MSVTIRNAEPRDAPSLGRLGAMLIRTHYEFDRRRFLAPREGTESGYAGFLLRMLGTAGNCVYVAEEDGNVVGYVWATLEPTSWMELRGPAGFIHDVAVAEESRRAGAGTKLMEAAIAWLRAQGAPRVMLWTAAPNAAAHALFRRLGFRETMTEMTRELDGKC